MSKLLSEFDQVIRCQCDEPVRLSDLFAHYRAGCDPLRAEVVRRRRRMSNGAWMDDAECRGSDTDDFFSDDASSPPHRMNVALRMCARCPVRRECLEDAYTATHTTEQGIRGGTTGRQRMRARNNPDRVNVLLERFEVEAHRLRLVFTKDWVPAGKETA